MAYNDLGDFEDGGWPPNNVDIDKADFRTFVTKVSQRIRTFLTVWNDYANQIMVVRSDGTGVSPAEVSESEFADLKNLKLRGANSYDVTITSSRGLNTATDAGNDIFANSSSSIVLAIAPDGDPEVGFTGDAAFRIWREGSGSVELNIDSSYDNQHPSGHTKIATQGLMIGVKIKGTKVFIAGDTAL